MQTTNNILERLNDKQSQFQVYNASAGSGKTFTLVKTYLKILLDSNDIFRFQNILAITFTNKAAAEMKERIINSLKDFSSADIVNENNPLFIEICTELDLEPNIIHKRSQKIIKSILNNYAAFNITTIDSFTYKLIRSFAYDLGLSLNFEVEMDAISLLNEAVDVLISRIGEDKKLTKTLIDFSIQKANEDQSWNIALDLKEIAKLLLNENDLLQVTKIEHKSIQDFIDLKTNINKQLKETKKQLKEIGNEALQLIDNLQIEYNDFYRSQLPTYFKNLVYDVTKIKFTKESSLAKNIEAANFYAKSKPQEIKNAINSIIPLLIDLFKKSESLFESYLLNKLISKSLIPLAILRSINNVLTEIKEDNNILLNAEFNQLISKHLKEQPVAFIYEKIGEKFRHYFIDEMQDTSVMQWQNLIPLIDNVLESENIRGEKGSLLLVGDAKQAIYRWRGGKAEQFINLANKDGNNPFLVPKKVNQLETNWRSFSEIIEFNNSFFQFLSTHFKNSLYQNLYHTGNQQKQNDKKGGFVQISFIEEGLRGADKDEVYSQKALEIIKNIEHEFNKNEICILTRTRKQGVVMAEYLTKHDIAIISSETLLLQNAPKVQFIINLLTIIQQPDDEDTKVEVLYFLHKHLNLKGEIHTFLSENLKLDNINLFKGLENFNIHFNQENFNTLPLYESIESIIRIFNLTTTSDAYLQFFLDVILDFSHKKSKGITSFLDYWKEKKDKLSIVVPEGKDAIRIMTIHKAKGLEFPVVIYPFDLDIYKQINPKIWYAPLDKKNYTNFDTSLINYNTSLKETGRIGASLYHSQQEKLELDSFNLLYVALTRAKEQLYIISEHKKQKGNPRYYSHFFINYLQDLEKWHTTQSNYSFGNIKRLSKKDKGAKKSIVQTDFISSNWRNHNINIVATSTINPNYDVEDARQYGNLIHEILAKITTKKDIKTTIETYINKGLIANRNKSEITKLIYKIINHPKLNNYFTEEVKILNEREIVTNEKLIVIPDRLIFEKDKVTIIDYKTGKKEKKHELQITNYASVLEKMNYTISKKILVYIGSEIEVVLIK